MSIFFKGLKCFNIINGQEYNKTIQDKKITAPGNCIVNFSTHLHGASGKGKVSLVFSVKGESYKIRLA